MPARLGIEEEKRYTRVCGRFGKDDVRHENDQIIWYAKGAPFATVLVKRRPVSWPPETILSG